MSEEPKWPCANCNQVFYTRSALKKHQLREKLASKKVILQPGERGQGPRSNPIGGGYHNG